MADKMAATNILKAIFRSKTASKKDGDQNVHHNYNLKDCVL